MRILDLTENYEQEKDEIKKHHGNVLKVNILFLRHVDRCESIRLKAPLTDTPIQEQDNTDPFVPAYLEIPANNGCLKTTA